MPIRWEKYMSNCTLCHTWFSLFQKEDKTLNNEPTHYFIHRIMSSSSYNQEDLISSARYMKLKQYNNRSLSKNYTYGKNGVPGKIRVGQVFSLRLSFPHSLFFPPIASHWVDLLRPSLFLHNPSFLVNWFLHLC